MKTRLISAVGIMLLMAATVKAAVVTNNLTTGNVALPAGGASATILEGTVDFAVTNAVTALDMFKCIKIPAGYIVLGASVKMDRIESTAGAGTVAVGLWQSAASSITNYFVASALMTNTTTVTSSEKTTNTTATSTWYITATPSTPCATGKVHVSACVIPFK